MSKLLDELLQSAGSGVPQLIEKLKQLESALDPPLANEARESYKRALRGKQMQAALIGAHVAGILCAKFGLKTEALEAHFDTFQILFMQAAAIEEYRSVYEGARNIVVKAREIQERDILVQAYVMAADTAYFASEAAGKDKLQKDKWLAVAVEDLLAVFVERPDVVSDRNVGHKFVSSLCATVEELETSGLSKDPSILSSLRHLAAKVETYVPLEFAVPGNEKKTRWIGQVLVTLSARFGDSEHAKRRLATTHIGSQSDGSAMPTR